MGRSTAIHNALHCGKIDRLAGLWLARLPKLSGEDCRRQLKIDVLTKADAISSP